LPKNQGDVLAHGLSIIPNSRKIQKKLHFVAFLNKFLETHGIQENYKSSFWVKLAKQD